MWGVLGLAFAVVATLGVIGFTRYQLSLGALESLESRVYLSLQLFVLEGGSVPGPVPWELQVARFAAPLLAAYAIIRGLALVFREQVDAIRLRLVERHVVVAGLGRKGSLLARALLRAGDRVVVIDTDRDHPELDEIRSLGAFVITGDARSPHTLRRARIARASHLVLVCGDDITNTEVYAQARELVSERSAGTLQCTVHLVSPELCMLLRGEELDRYGEAPIRVDFVNVHSAAALALLRAHPPAPRVEGERPRVAIVGNGITARYLVVALARTWAMRSPAATERLPIGLVDAEPGLLAELAAAHAEVARFTELNELEDPGAIADGAPDVVYVCPGDDAVAATRALELRALLAGRAARIVIVLEQRTGLGHLLENAPQPLGGPRLELFGMLDDACQPEVLLTGTSELIAQALHQVYRESRAAEAGPQDDPALVPWAELSEGLRESNRDQAAHIAVKLAAIGNVVGPMIDWDAAQRPFQDAEVETMARLEHDRWAAERRRSGWQPGPRDPVRHTTPFLVPWEELSEPVRDRDRMFVRQLPSVLASVGLQARPVDGCEPTPQRAAGVEAIDASSTRDGG